MINELLLMFSVVFIYGAAILGYALFGKAGLYCVSAVATILANIEALILVNAFSMEQTLGNVLFAVTFLITDILSGQKSRQQGGSYGNTLIGIFSCAFTKLDALQSESERHDYAVNQGGFLKHSPNDFCIPHCLRNKSAVRCLALPQVVEVHGKEIR